MFELFSKQLFIHNKIKTPNYFFLSGKDYSGVNLNKKIKKNKLKFPIVIKPNDEGSSIGVKICKTYFSLKRSFNFLKKSYENLIFETFIPGKEIQVAEIGGRAVEAIELRPKRKFYDYQAKYSSNAKTKHIIPVDLKNKDYNCVL